MAQFKIRQITNSTILRNHNPLSINDKMLVLSLRLVEVLAFIILLLNFSWLLLLVIICGSMFLYSVKVGPVSSTLIHAPYPDYPTYTLYGTVVSMPMYSAAELDL